MKIVSQVMREFWRNRIGVLANRGAGLKDTLDALNKQRRATVDVIERWGKTTATRTDDVEALLDKVAVFYSLLEKEICARNPTPQTLGDGNVEPVLNQLEKLLQGKVGKKPTQAEFEAAVKEGSTRAKRQQPPGYVDADDKTKSNLPERGAGDYLVWIQAISEATRRNLDVLLITGDEKEDWWWRYRSEFLGPRVELVDELRARCGRQLYMMRPVDLIRRAPALNVKVQRESVDDVERVSRESAPGTMYGRDEETWDELVNVGLDYLIEVARLRSLTTYSELNDLLKLRAGSGFDFDRADERGALGHLLGRIVERNYPEVTS